ncbi:MAG: acyl-CoA-binding protein [Promethearchaeota archaeon]|nr:MAG: acyl-CoA-binding protein [Candidatus Lokiarchaeota archaeon]
MSVDNGKTLKSEFEEAIARSDKLPKQPVDTQLELYGLYKQALFGDVTGERPGRLKVKDRAKFDNWESRKGMLKEDAMKAYITLIEKLEQEKK